MYEAKEKLFKLLKAHVCLGGFWPDILYLCVFVTCVYSRLTDIIKRFFAPQITENGRFWVQRMGLGMPKSKNGDHFLLPNIPKYGGIDFCFT